MKLAQITLSLLLIIAVQAHAFSKEELADIERGRYLVKTTGCNDCHTPAYGMKNGLVPEKDWLIGDGVGWKGPWGTTYPTNLRARVNGMSEKDFIQYAKNFKARPPMPWFSVNHMKKEDIRAMYRFIKFLGPSKNEVPLALAPGETPKGPYIDMTVIVPGR